MLLITNNPQPWRKALAPIANGNALDDSLVIEFRRDVLGEYRLQAGNYGVTELRLNDGIVQFGDQREIKRFREALDHVKAEWIDDVFGNLK